MDEASYLVHQDAPRPCSCHRYSSGSRLTRSSQLQQLLLLSYYRKTHPSRNGASEHCRPYQFRYRRSYPETAAGVDGSAATSSGRTDPVFLVLNQTSHQCPFSFVYWRRSHPSFRSFALAWVERFSCKTRQWLVESLLINDIIDTVLFGQIDRTPTILHKAVIHSIRHQVILEDHQGR